MAEKFESEMTIKMETIKTGWIAEKQSGESNRRSEN